MIISGQRCAAHETHMSSPQPFLRLPLSHSPLSRITHPPPYTQLDSAERGVASGRSSLATQRERVAALRAEMGTRPMLAK